MVVENGLSADVFHSNVVLFQSVKQQFALPLAKHVAF